MSLNVNYLRKGGNVFFARLCLLVCVCVCVCVCEQDNWKSYGPMFVKFYGNVMNGKNYKWLKFFFFGGGWYRRNAEL